MRLIVDGNPISIENGENLLAALLKADAHPTGGGCLCMGGDCPHCLVTIDGVSYIRACQTEARPGMIIERHFYGDSAYPPLPANLDRGPDVKRRHVHCDVLVIGAGDSGQRATQSALDNGKHVVLLDAAKREEVVGIYAGPLVVAKTADGMLNVYPKEDVIVATGAAEIQPVAPNNLLNGLVTARAASQLHAAGVKLGHVVAVGTPPEGIDYQQAVGQLVRFEGEVGVEAVVTRDGAGKEHRYECDTVSLGLGLHPRDALARQGHDIPQVRAVGNAARDSDIPPCPVAGIVCACSGVSVADLQYTWEHGFRELELVKRSTLAGTGTCQGSVCLPHMRSFLADRGRALQKPFTARPMTRQLTFGEVAAGAHHHPTARTALDAIHRKLGASMEHSGGWWRPWNYGNPVQEYWAVREAVSLMDVSTLGKFIVTGPDALQFLERLYPTKVHTIRSGRSRYVLILDERGYVMDDGLVCKETDTRYLLTFTSGGASHSEMWLRDWSESWGMDVRILNQTWTQGAINVTGPLAKQLLARAGLTDLPKYMHHAQAEIFGIPVHIFRLSFTGECSFELHHPAQHAEKLWNGLMELGSDLGIKPHGLETLLDLRLEKGHIIVGQDTDFDSTPRRIDHEWAVKLDKDNFVGKQSIIRTNAIERDKMLVGFEMDDIAPNEGAIIYQDGEYMGYLTSSAWSPVLNKGVMLGWLFYKDGQLAQEVMIHGKTARRVALPFYDKEGARARV